MQKYLSIVLWVVVPLFFSCGNTSAQVEMKKQIAQLNESLPIRITPVLSLESISLDEDQKMINNIYRLDSKFMSKEFDVQYTTIFPKLSKECLFFLCGAANDERLINMLEDQNIGLRYVFDLDNGRNLIDVSYSSKELLAIRNGNRVTLFNEFYSLVARESSKAMCPYEIEDGVTMKMMSYTSGNPKGTLISQLPVLTRFIELDDEIAVSVTKEVLDEFILELLSMIKSENAQTFGSGFRILLKVIVLDSMGNVLDEGHLVNEM